MEKAREAGHTRSIGVSNFSAAEIGQLLELSFRSSRSSPVSRGGP
jgi:diketogulonate reductase-like aldo/keto reductase